MADVITCPSGLQGRVRGMKVREERVLADRKLAKSGGQVDELLAAPEQCFYLFLRICRALASACTAMRSCPTTTTCCSSR